MKANKSDNTKAGKDKFSKKKCSRCNKFRKPHKLNKASYGYSLLCWTCKRCIEKGVVTSEKAVHNHTLEEF